MSAATGDVQRIVPPTGVTARLTVFVAGAMAFLAVFALALLFSTGRVADRWSSELARTATIRVSAPPEQLVDQTAATLAILGQTPGVASARALDDAEQADLLAPWLGAALPLEDLPVPRLIEIAEDGQGFDAEGLRLRLRAEVPGAVLDDHTRWRRPLVEAAGRMRMVGWVAMALIGLSLAAMVVLAANAALAANAR
ncbi:MAG: cell division protein FtsX, partial [Pseudomonadota bacterium]